MGIIVTMATTTVQAQAIITMDTDVKVIRMKVAMAQDTIVQPPLAEALEQETTAAQIPIWMHDEGY
ncbi:hypothetical protein JCM10914_4342 [Paenibacillus sp. JCM 10914]|nr:hypothetical protein JCM10914_4342 [Paenibacillus sp. JCM 10914]